MLIKWRKSVTSNLSCQRSHGKVDMGGIGKLNEVLKPSDMFSTAPGSPLKEGELYKDAIQRSSSGDLSLTDFLSGWALMTRLDPIFSVKNLIYIGYLDEPSSAIRVTRRKRLDVERQQSDRNVYQCFLFGPKEAGNFLSSFIGRPSLGEDKPTSAHQYGVNTVNLEGEKERMPIILVACKSDLHLQCESDEPTLDQLRDYTLATCSAKSQDAVYEVLFLAQKSVIHPRRALLSSKDSLEPKCTAALKCIFLLSDHDQDDRLNDEELKALFARWFGSSLSKVELVGIRRVLDQQVPEQTHESPSPANKSQRLLSNFLLGQGNRSLTFEEFCNFHLVNVRSHLRQELTWTMLRKFGYNDGLKLRDNVLLLSVKRREPDETLELTDNAVKFLKYIFTSFANENKILKPTGLEKMFSTAPESPLKEGEVYKGAIQRSSSGDLSLTDFLSGWALMTRLDPIFSVKNLIYIGYLDAPSFAIRVTRRRRLDVERQQSDRNVYQCFLFGPKEAGNFLSSFIGRPSLGEDKPTSAHQYGVNTINLEGVSQDLGIAAPLRIGVELELFKEMVIAAEHPHMSIPETEAGKSLKQYQRRFKRPLLFVAAVGAVGLVFMLQGRMRKAEVVVKQDDGTL